MKLIQVSKFKLISVVVAALVANLFVPSLTYVAQAAPGEQFTNLFVRPDRLQASVATGVTVCATPSAESGARTETSVKITFPDNIFGGATDFAVDSTPANWTVTGEDDTSGDLPTGAIAWPGIGGIGHVASDVTGKTVTFASNGLTAGTMYCFHTAAMLTNSTAATSPYIVGALVQTEDGGGSPIVNQTRWAYTPVTNDLLTVTAVVPPNFTLTMTDNVDAFTTNLDPLGIVSTAGEDINVSTNARGGWIAWAKDQYQGLYSAGANYTIASGLKNLYPAQTKNVGDAAFDLVASTAGNAREGYVMDVDMKTDAANGCSLATLDGGGIDAAYDSASGNGGGVLSSTGYRPIARCVRVGGDPGTSDGDTLTLTERAVIRGGTPAGADYSDVITVVGAGNF